MEHVKGQEVSADRDYGHHASPAATKRSTGTYILLGLVCLLLILSVVQTFQIGNVQEKIQKSAIGAGIAATGGAVARDAQPRAAAVPSMVGGC